MLKKLTFLSFAILILTIQIEAAEQLTNASVINMIKIGLNEEIIITKIKSSVCDFDTSDKALLDLQSNGISMNIIKTMIEKSAAVPVAKPETGIPAVLQMNQGEMFFMVKSELKK